MATVKQENGVTVVELDESYSSLGDDELQQFRSFLLETASACNPPHLAVDLSHTKFFGSAFLEVLFRAWNRVKSRKGQFVLFGLSDNCEEVFRACDLDQLWVLVKSREDAVNSCSNHSS